MASTGWDVVGEYKDQYPDKIRNRCKPGMQLAYPDEIARAAEPEKPLPKVAQKPKTLRGKKEKTKKEIDNSGDSQYIDATNNYPPLSDQEQTIFSLVREGMTLVDDIIAQTKLPAGAVLAALTMLEVKGLVRRLPGKRVTLK
jgi:predicted Rossmann fold nucleotide-binding protein DprA/Smf involved in DNA uptake